MPSSPLSTSIRAALGRLLVLATSRDREVRWLVVLSAVLLASGVAHGLVWLLDGVPSLAGPVSWRKPIVFGLSAGVTTASVAWLVSLLDASASRARWARLYGVTMVLEIFLIDLQRWRGVGSHYNVATPLDGAIFSAMGVLICVSVASLGVLGWRAARSAAVPVDTRAAAGAGVALLLVGSLVGAAMASHGSAIGATGGGWMKLPHFVALHAIQTLPALAWWLERRGAPVDARARLVRWTAAAHTLLLAVSLAWAALAR